MHATVRTGTNGTIDTSPDTSPANDISVLAIASCGHDNGNKIPSTFDWLMNVNKFTGIQLNFHITVGHCAVLGNPTDC